MVKEKTIEWAEKKLKEGKNEQEIKKELKETGYSETQVKEIMKKAGNNGKETKKKEDKGIGGMSIILIAVVALAIIIVLGIIGAIVAAIGGYFWVGSMATQPEPAQHPRTIVASPVTCSTGNTPTTITISHTSPESREPIATGDLKASGATEGFTGPCPSSELAPGDSAQCELPDFGEGDGTVTFYGDNTAQTQVTC